MKAVKVTRGKGAVSRLVLRFISRLTHPFQILSKGVYCMINGIQMTVKRTLLITYRRL